MAFCGKCGTKVEDGVKFCPACGTGIEASGGVTTETAAPAAQPAAQSAPAADVTSKLQNFNNTADTTAEFDRADIEQNKIMGVLSYLSWLVLIPLFAAPKSKFARFHANQGLALAIVEVVWWIATAILTAVLWAILGYSAWGIYSLITTLLGLVNIFFVVLAILGIVNAANGNAKALPIVGKFKILK